MKKSKRIFKTASLVAVLLTVLTTPGVAGQFRVIGVDDGDSIRVSGHGKTFWVRLAGIDAPEKPKGNLAPGQPFYYEAKQFLVNRVLYKSIELKTYGLDQYGSTFGIVTLEGKNINIDLVRSGLAEVYRGRLPEGFDATPFRQAEAVAKKAKKGIWSLGDQYVSPSTWKEKQKEKNGMKQGPDR